MPHELQETIELFQVPSGGSNSGRFHALPVIDYEIKLGEIFRKFLWLSFRYVDRYLPVYGDEFQIALKQITEQLLCHALSPEVYHLSQILYYEMLEFSCLPDITVLK